MGWFTKIDVDRLDWEIAHWEWLRRNLRPRFDLDRARLIMPTPEDFPVVPGTAEEKAHGIFRCVQKYFGIEDWPCRLEPFEEAGDILRETVPPLARPESTAGAAGTFEVTESREVVIRYKVSQVKDPMALVATMAHELCHYILSTIKNPPPDGWGQHEPITDLAAVAFGFGIFLANSSFRFSQWQGSSHQGWSAQSQGYLSQSDLALALALFCVSKNLPPEPVRKFLTTGPRHYFKVYSKDLLKEHGERMSRFQIGEEGHSGFLCPACRTAPPRGRFWCCPRCETKFDTFATRATCPSCKVRFARSCCLACDATSSLGEWASAANRDTAFAEWQAGVRKPPAGPESNQAQATESPDPNLPGMRPLQKRVLRPTHQRAGQTRGFFLDKTILTVLMFFVRICNKYCSGTHGRRQERSGQPPHAEPGSTLLQPESSAHPAMQQTPPHNP